jgi:hypothetical protein
MAHYNIKLGNKRRQPEAVKLLNILLSNTVLYPGCLPLLNS